MGGSGGETRPPDGEKAEAASDCCKPQHPEEREKMLKPTMLELKLGDTPKDFFRDIFILSLAK